MINDRGPQFRAVLAVLFPLSFVAVGLRFYTHGFIIRRFFAEDWVALVALIFYGVYTAAGLVAISYGLGKHVSDVPADNRSKAIMWRWLAELFYIVVSCLTKWVVGLFLLRICPNARWRKITIWTILGAVAIFNTIYFFIALFSCNPVEYEWDRYKTIRPVGSCNATTFATVTTYVAAFLNVLGDWVLPALPATLVWKSQMNRRLKISVVVLLALGSIASIATIVRIPYARSILNNPDYLYNFTDLGIWSTVELAIALIASSLATVKPLLRKMNIFSTNSEPTVRPSIVKTTSSVAHRVSEVKPHDYASIGSYVEITAGTNKGKESWWRRETGSIGDKDGAAKSCQGFHPFQGYMVEGTRSKDEGGTVDHRRS